MTIEIPDYWDWLADGPTQLRDARRRLWWAHEDGETLHRELMEFINSDPYGMLIEFDDDRWHVTFRRFIEEREEWDRFERFSRLIGSYLDNMRAALHYTGVACARQALADDPSLADESLNYRDRLHPEWIEFPIFKVKAKFLSTGEKRIRKLPSKYRKAITDEQPYHGGNKGLWDLQELSAEFRHRVVHPVAVIPQRHLFKVLLDGQPVQTTNPEIYVENGPIKDHEEIMSFGAVGIPNDRYEDVKPQITISVGLDHSLCRGRDCVGVINRIGRDAVAVTEKFESLFQ